MLRLLPILLLLCLTSTTSGKTQDAVTCDSVVKLLNTKTGSRLHSHDIKYGSGSGQQSVTGVDDVDDNNSHWAVRGLSDKPCTRGVPIKCNEPIRLEHLTTGCLLHSHHFSSPLSHNQEVSCFGKNGEGDTGDYWYVKCDGTYWRQGEEVRFKHKDTEMFLGSSGQKYGRPISGQKEICAISSSGSQTNWKTVEGIFFQPSE